MLELELSVMDSQDNTINALRQALSKFETQYCIQVKLRVLPWDTAWSELVRVALYKSGPDVSEVGTTWIDTFVSMNALRQFESREINTLGGAAAFLPSLWRSGALLGQSQVWAVPWLSDTRLIYYRRDILQQAGIDPHTAFVSLDHLTQTLQRLQDNGVAIPLTIPTAHPRTILHMLAPWVWQAGGHFTSPEGKRVLFNEPPARTGIKAYFDLRRYLSPPTHHLTDTQTCALFRQGQAAVIISGHWLLNNIREDSSPEVAQNLGTTIIPGIPYVGGSNLVMWQHSRQTKAAITLVRYLTSLEAQTQVIAQNGRLPARLDALANPPFTTDPHYQVIGESLKTGRSFQATYMWGLIEDKLTQTLVKIWTILLANPTRAIDDVLTQYLEPLAKELNQSLASYQ